MNLLEKLKKVHEQLRPQFNPRDADRVLEALGPDGREAWKRANLPEEKLVRDPDDTQRYAKMCGVDLTDI